MIPVIKFATPAAGFGILYTTADVAKREGVSSEQIRIWCRQGLIFPCEKLGFEWLIHKNYICLGIAYGKRGRPRNGSIPLALAPPERKKIRNATPVRRRPVHGNKKKK